MTSQNTPLSHPVQSPVTISPISETALHKRERRWVSGILIALAGVYGLLPFVLTPLQALLHPDAYGGFWAPDSGPRFAMIRNWVEHGSLIHLYYPYSDIDPSGQIHPLAYFLFHRAHDFTSMYSPVFPLLCGLAYRTLASP